MDQTERAVLVYLEIDRAEVLVGRLFAHSRRGRESATFEYDAAWLRSDARFPLGPALTLAPGPFHSPAHAPLLGALGDSAPDRWGRQLMRRAERRRAARAGETPRTLLEIDFLLRVDDEARQGALRFAERLGGPFLAEPQPDRIPPLVEIPRLLGAADRVLDGAEADEDLRLLLAPGASLGGARPKASVRDRDGSLSLAKFPRRDDEIDTVRWEAVALDLAKQAGITVPSARVEVVADRPVLVLRRFDRTGSARIPFLSALAMLDARDHDTRSYLEMVDVLRMHGAAPQEDMRQLWRRIVFNVLVSNTDDHLRNHAFLFESRGRGWRLAPAYDLNPVPVDIRPRLLTTSIDLDDVTASLDLALDVAGYFELDPEQRHRVASEVGSAVARWREVASAHGLSRAEQDRMATAFEHDDLRAALSFAPC